MNFSAFRKNLLRALVGACFVFSLVWIEPAMSARADAPDAAPDVLVQNDGAVFQAETTARHFSPPYRGTGKRTMSERATTFGADEGDAQVRDHTHSSIIGPDERRPVKNSARYPSRAIASIKMRFSDGAYLCTAWFIGPDTLATAGHCVYDPYLQEFAQVIRVFPGRDANGAPFGKARSVKFATTQCWIKSGSPDCDYGVIQINKNLGETVGWFGFGWEGTDNKLLNHKVTLRGYPGDKSPYGTDWTMGGALEQLTQTRVGYSIDTFGGQSGSPVYAKYAFPEGTCKPCVLGIHGYAVGVNPFLTRNSGVRITRQVFQNMLAWRDQ